MKKNNRLVCVYLCRSIFDDSMWKSFVWLENTFPWHCAINSQNSISGAISSFRHVPLCCLSVGAKHRAGCHSCIGYGLQWRPQSSEWVVITSGMTRSAINIQFYDAKLVGVQRQQKQKCKNPFLFVLVPSEGNGFVLLHNHHLKMSAVITLILVTSTMRCCLSYLGINSLQRLS